MLNAIETLFSGSAGAATGVAMSTLSAAEELWPPSRRGAAKRT